MICLKIPAENAELGNLHTIDSIETLLGECEKSVSWLAGSLRLERELENLAFIDLSQV
jgi:hypothetical protein